MALTVAIRFPFALLVLLGIIVITAVRVPHVLGWVVSPTDGDKNSNIQIEGAGWLIDLNHRYEALPELRRIWVYPAALLIAGAINMMLTIKYGFPFGLLFLIALLALVILRAPYTASWVRRSAPSVSGSPIQALPPAMGGPSETQFTHEGNWAASIDQAGPRSSAIEGSSAEGAIEPHDREIKNSGE
jgi:hypothetical protein